MKSNPQGQVGRSLIVEAAGLMEAGRLPEAEAKCRAILAKAPNQPDALQLLGVILGNLGKTDEAIAALEKSVKSYPKNPGAWTNLAVLLRAAAPARAVQCFKRALELDPHSLHARGNLAELYHEMRRFDDAETEINHILTRAPNHAAAIRLLARGQHMRGNSEREVELIRRLIRLTPDDRELPAKLREAYFLWYDSVYREHDKAIAILEKWLADDPEAPVARHMHASLTRKNVPERASPEYVEHHFDAFAEQFDSVLSSLEYRAPELVRQCLAEVIPAASASLDIVDIGCGTGRLGPLVAPWKRRLVGVDLSGKILEEAKKRGLYDALDRADITPYLAERPASFDVVAVVDTLVYFGDLRALFASVFGCLRPGGRFIGTIEKLAEAEAEPIRLHTGGRYAHKESTLRSALETAGFVVERTREETLRLESAKGVAGVVFSARRS